MFSLTEFGKYMNTSRPSIALKPKVFYFSTTESQHTLLKSGVSFFRGGSKR
eukprot:UN17351